MKKCLYCFRPVPDDHHGNSGVCCEKHKKLRKSTREKANYIKRTAISKPILKLQDLLIEFANRFGYETAIELQLLVPTILTGPCVQEPFKKRDTQVRW